MSNNYVINELLSVSDIFLFDGDDFISVAYKLILGRQVDEPGLTHYRQILLRTGSRARVASNLLDSFEGRANPHWNEIKITVRKQRRREFWWSYAPRRFRARLRGTTRARDLDRFAKSVSPRTMTLAKILASAEHG